MMEKDNSRADVEAAFDAHSDGDSSPDTAPEPIDTPEPADVPEAAPEDVEDAPSNETPTEKAARTRDDAGRFAAKAKEAAEARAKDGKDIGKTGKETAKPSQQELRPPQSLSAVERESFKQFPRAMQEILVRREREQAIAVQKYAEPARFGQQMQQVIAPYAQSIQALGGDVTTAVGNLLRTGHVLQYGTPAQKADAVYGVLSQFGVDLDLVNARLEGRPVGQQAQPQFDPNQMAQQIRQSVMQDFAQQRQQVASQRADAEVSTFADTHPYFDDVRDMMGTLMEAAHRSNRQMDMERAYSLACQSTPDVAAALSKSRANTSMVSTQRTRAAASSLKPRPSFPTSQSAQRNGRDNSRDDVEAAWDALANQSR